MKNFIQAFGVLLFSYQANAQDIEGKVPFHYPQTSLWTARNEFNARFKNDVVDETHDMKPQGLNSYGFDIEIPYTDFFNIGFFFKFDIFKSGTISDLDLRLRIASLLGFFGRFQYNPFGGDVNLFGKVDLGFGPVVQGFSGMMLHSALSGGLEYYVNEWVGLLMSYGFIYELGRETLVGGLAEDEKYKGIRMSTLGRSITFGIKTTYF